MIIIMIIIVIITITIIIIIIFVGDLKGGERKGGARKSGGPKFRAFPSPATIFILSSFCRRRVKVFRCLGVQVFGAYGSGVSVFRVYGFFLEGEGRGWGFCSGVLGV